MRFILSVVLFSFLLLGQAHSKPLNIYLKFDQPALKESIAAFNTYLDSEGIFTKYQIEPFLNQYPLHITLYLAAFTDAELSTVKAHVAEIASHWGPISIKTSNLVVSDGSYVMLDLDNNPVHGINPPLQQLSDTVALDLNLLRDTSDKIPDWAQSIPSKRKAFEHYGSPNVFFEYTPHFTLMAKAFADPVQAKQFQEEVATRISQYSFPDVMTSSVAIGIGYVNSFGQVTEEIAVYPLLR